MISPCFLSLFHLIIYIFFFTFFILFHPLFSLLIFTLLLISSLFTLFILISPCFFSLFHPIIYLSFLNFFIYFTLFFLPFFTLLLISPLFTLFQCFISHPCHPFYFPFITFAWPHPSLVTLTLLLTLFFFYALDCLFVSPQSLFLTLAHLQFSPQICFHPNLSGHPVHKFPQPCIFTLDRVWVLFSHLSNSSPQLVSSPYSLIFPLRPIPSPLLDLSSAFHPSM